MTTVELHASGLGLMLYSPAATAQLVEHHDYSPRGHPEGELARLLAAQQVVLLSTGSPQLDYVIHVHPPGETAVVRSFRARTQFPIEITGGRLGIRDGYDTMDWRPDGESTRLIPLRDDRYLVDACWVPEPDDQALGRMRLHLLFTPSVAHVESDGWAELLYSAT